MPGSSIASVYMAKDRKLEISLQKEKTLKS